MKPCFHAGQGCRGPAGNPRFPGTCNPHATREGRDMTMTQYGTWVSYSGGARIELAIVLLAAAAGLAYAGTRLPLPARAARPGRAAMIFMLVTWVLASICEAPEQSFSVWRGATTPICLFSAAICSLYGRVA